MYKNNITTYCDLGRQKERVEAGYLIDDVFLKVCKYGHFVLCFIATLFLLVTLGLSEAHGEDESKQEGFSFWVGDKNSPIRDFAKGWKVNSTINDEFFDVSRILVYNSNPKHGKYIPRNMIITRAFNAVVPNMQIDYNPVSKLFEIYFIDKNADELAGFEGYIHYGSEIKIPFVLLLNSLGETRLYLGALFPKASELAESSATTSRPEKDIFYNITTE